VTNAASSAVGQRAATDGPRPYESSGGGCAPLSVSLASRLPSVSVNATQRQLTRRPDRTERVQSRANRNRSICEETNAAAPSPGSGQPASYDDRQHCLSVAEQAPNRLRIGTSVPRASRRGFDLHVKDRVASSASYVPLIHITDRNCTWLDVRCHQQTHPHRLDVRRRRSSSLIALSGAVFAHLL